MKLSSSYQFICQFEVVATHCSTMTLKSHCALLRFRWLKNSVHMNMSQWSNVQIWDIFLNCHNQLIWWHWTCHLSQFSWYVWCALYYHSYLAGRRLSTRITFQQNSYHIEQYFNKVNNVFYLSYWNSTLLFSVYCYQLFFFVLKHSYLFVITLSWYS